MSANDDLKIQLEQMAINEANQSAQLAELKDWVIAKVADDAEKTSQLAAAQSSLAEQTALITQLQNELAANSAVPANLVNLANLVQSSQTAQSVIIGSLLDIKNPPAPIETSVDGTVEETPNDPVEGERDDVVIDDTSEL